MEAARFCIVGRPPELDQLRAHLSAMMPHRVAAGVLAYLLPVEAGKSPEILRRHTLKIGEEVLVRSGLVWGFSCQAVVLGFAHSSLFGAGKAVQIGKRRVGKE